MRYLFVLVLIAGCASRPAPLTEDEVLAKLDSQCTKIGFTAGSAEHKNCKLELWRQYLADTNAASRSGAANKAAASSAFVNRPRTCVPIGGGGVSCY